MTDDDVKLLETCFDSYAPYASEELEARFKATKDLHFDGLPTKYINLSMTRMQGNRYLMHAFKEEAHKYESHCIDVDSMKVERLELSIGNTSSCFVDGDHMLVVRYDRPMIILRDLQVIGHIEFDAKNESCKNYERIRGRYEQHANRSVYALDRKARLYRIEWQDIKDIKDNKNLEKKNVKHFYVDKNLGLATLNTYDTLSLPSGAVVDLKAKVKPQAEWATVARIAKSWIACGELDCHAIMASVNNKGDIKSILKLRLTSNGYVNYSGRMFAGIYSLQNVFVRGRRGIMLAIERDGCCHLISVAYGRLSMLQSIASIVNADVTKYYQERVVTSVTATGRKGEFIACGFNWTKLIVVKLK